MYVGGTGSLQTFTFGTMTLSNSLCPLTYSVKSEDSSGNSAPSGFHGLLSITSGSTLGTFVVIV
jgi:hypothetical protein